MNDARTPLFFGRAYPREVIEERAAIVRDLVEYVGHGVQSQYDPRPLPAFKTFRDAVMARLGEFLLDGFPAPVRLKLFTGHTAELIAEAYKDARSLNTVQAIATPNLRNEELVKQLGRLLKTKPIHLADSSPATVKGAYVMARNNLIQVDTQLVTLSVIHDLTRYNEFSNVEPFPGNSEIRTELYSRARSFTISMLTFGGLLGGDEARDAVLWAARDSCHSPNGETNWSIIQFLQAGGRVPGSYATKTDDEFRADIKRCYDARAKAGS